MKRNLLGFIGVLAILLAAVYGAGFSMYLDSQGGMQGCPFAAETGSMCPMDTVSHILAWDSAFTGHVELAALFALLAFAMAALFGIGHEVLAEKSKFRSSELAPVRIRDPFLELFSQGILHPRIYA